MDCASVMRDLEAAGTAQNRKVYTRHGVGENMFGVSYGNLKSMVKKIKTNQELAEQLWATGNHDARVLATMIADPAAMKDRIIEGWAKDIDSYVLSDAFVQAASRAAGAVKKTEKWTKAKSEWLGRVGWLMVATLASDASVPDSFFEPYLETIATEIHTRKNYVRAAMNTALIAIGIRNAALEKKALAVAKRIGKVEVDHGETNCKTPDAADYIRKARERAKKK